MDPLLARTGGREPFILRGWHNTQGEPPDFLCVSVDTQFVALKRGALVDATRLADGKIVKLKKTVDTTHPYELEINRLFSSEPYVSHARNHCVPVSEILNVPGEEHVHILVMPLLRPFDDVVFETVGEAVGFFHQVFEVSVMSELFTSGGYNVTVGSTIYASVPCCTPVSVSPDESPQFLT